MVEYINDSSLIPAWSENEWKRDRWGYRAAKALKPVVRETYESDWMQYGACVPDQVTDRHGQPITDIEIWQLDFLTKPVDPAPLERICKKCPVSMQCMEWADKHNPTGVFIAGEWRE